MSTLVDRIQEIMDSKGWGVQEIADIAEVSRSAAAQWLGQGSKIIHSIGKLEGNDPVNTH